MSPDHPFLLFLLVTDSSSACMVAKAWVWAGMEATGESGAFLNVALRTNMSNRYRFGLVG